MVKYLVSQIAHTTLFPTPPPIIKERFFSIGDTIYTQQKV